MSEQDPIFADPISGGANSTGVVPTYPVPAGMRPVGESSVGGPLPVAAVVGGVTLFVVYGVLAAIVTVLLVPLRIGTTLAPLSILLALATNVALPALMRRLVRSTAAAIAPVLAWFITLAVLAGSRPEGDVLIPGASSYRSLAYVFYAVALVGLIAAAVTIARTDPRRRAHRNRTRPAFTERPAPPAAIPPGAYPPGAIPPGG